MAAEVGTRRPGAPDTVIDAGSAVRGITWNKTAQLTNWTLGRGAMLIPASFPVSSIAAGVVAEFYYRTRPRYAAFQRAWHVTLRTEATASVTVEIIVGSTTTTRGVPFGRSGQTFRIIESLASQAEAEETLTLSIEPTGGAAIVESVSCWEIPRAELIATVGSDDRGTETPRFAASQPVVAGNYTNAIEVLADDAKIGRRASLWQWSVPATDGGSTTTTYATAVTSSSYVDVLDLPTTMLTRKIGPSDVTGTVTCRVLGWVSAGNSQVKLYDGSSSSGVASISATSATWSSSFTFAVDCDDVGSTDGRQTAASPAWNSIDLQARKLSGGTLYIAAISVWET